MKHLTYLLVFGALLLTASCASHKPGDPAHAWLNGTWAGRGGAFDREFRLEVVDGNKVIGTMTNCRVTTSGCGSGPITGMVSGDQANVAGEMSSGTFHFVLTKGREGYLGTDRGFTLKKR